MPLDGLNPESVNILIDSLQGQPITIAFSGGVDSSVLLHLLASHPQRHLLGALKAVHIHHGLSDFADQWVASCELFCQRWDVPLDVVYVNISGDSADGIEQAARNARYQVFTDALKNGAYLLMGHHQDDQAETLLLRLFRGTGVDGLQAMPLSRPLGAGHLYRPLLKISRAEIETYARQYELSWIEDDSNMDKRFSRNFLRHRIIPEIEQRWPGASGRIAELAEDVTEINKLLGSQVSDILQPCVERKPEWLLGQQPLLAIPQLLLLNEFQQRQVLREWLKQQALLMPGRKMLEQVFDELVVARADAEPLLNLGSYNLRRFRHYLVVDSGSDYSGFTQLQWNWQQMPELGLPNGWRLMVKDNTDGQLPEGILNIKWREHVSPNEKIAIAGRTGRKKLKRWLQEYNVPYWLRDQVPLIYHGEQMVAAPGLWACKGYETCPVILKVPTDKALNCYLITPKMVK